MNLPPFGVKAHDSITGFQGIVTGHCSYIDGTTQVRLTPRVDNSGNLREAQWFDQERILFGDDSTGEQVGFR